MTNQQFVKWLLEHHVESSFRKWVENGWTPRDFWKLCPEPHWMHWFVQITMDAGQTELSPWFDGSWNIDNPFARRTPRRLRRVCCILASGLPWGILVHALPEEFQ